MNRIACAVATLVTLTSAPALADVTRVFFVVVPIEENVDRDALRLQISSSQVLKKDSRLEVVEPPGLTHAGKAVDATKAVDEVNALVVQIDYAGAKSRAEVALSALKAADFRVIRSQYLQLLIQSARIKFALKADNHGATDLSDAFVLDTALDAPRDLNTKERSWFEAARKTSLAAPRAAAVMIESSGRNGWVWVDGQFVGVTPVSVPNAAVGRHFITFLAPGAEVLHRSELLGSIARVRLSAEPTEAGRTYLALVAGLAAGIRKGTPQAAAIELLRWSKSDELMAVGLSGSSEPKATVLRFTNAGTVPARTIDLAEEGGQAQAVAQAALAAFDTPIVAQAGAPSSAVRAPPQVEVRAGKSKAPAVAMFAVALAGVAVGTGMLVAGQSSFSGARSIPQVDQAEYAQTVGRGRGLTGGGIAAVSVAAAAVGVGVVLLW